MDALSTGVSRPQHEVTLRLNVAIHSLQVEKHVLAGVVKHPQTFCEIIPFINDLHFFDEIHKTIFLIIRNLSERNERWDKVVLAEKVKNLGIVFKDDVNIYDYIDNLSFIPITVAATIDAARELLKLYLRRTLETTFEEALRFVRTNGNLRPEEIVSGADAIYGKVHDIYKLDDQPQNLFEGIIEMVEERGNNPLVEVGLQTPYSEFNRLYGGLKPKHIVAVGSRPGQGKSTWLEDIAIKTAEINDTKAFICDTEMLTEEIRWRAMAARSGVGEWYVESGNWRKNEAMTSNVRGTYDKITEYKNKKYVTHYHVGDKSLDAVISIIRRWHAANIKPGQKAIIVYDYLKLTEGENVTENWAEYQLLGQKINRLKRLAEELDAVILTAIQLNRSGENHNRRGNTVVDDSSAFAGTDRLQHLAAFTGIFRCKTLDEIAADGPEYGTHKLIPLKTRFQGKDAAGHQDTVRRVNEEGDFVWVRNYLNFAVTNFEVVELGSLRQMVASQAERGVSPDVNPNDGVTL